MVANKARTILIGAVLIAGTAIISSGCPQPIGPPIDAPVAAIGAQPASGVAPLQVQFADQSDPGTSAIATWTWDFGDGTTSAVPNPSHVYAAAGGYSVLLTVTTADGTDTASAGIVVAEGVWDLPHPVAAPAEYVNLGVFPYHRPDSALYGPNCSECHSDRLMETAAHADIPAAHSLMPGYFGVDDNRCLKCHTDGADLVYRSTNYFRAARYEAGWCASPACHGASGPRPLYAVDQ